MASPLHSCTAQIHFLFFLIEYSFDYYCNYDHAVVSQAFYSLLFYEYKTLAGPCVRLSLYSSE
jgi:hypothetical protein